MAKTPIAITKPMASHKSGKRDRPDGSMLARRVRSCRTKMRLTQEGLAKLANVPQPNISRLESGRVESIHAFDLGRVALALNTSTDYLLGMTDQLPPEEITIRDQSARDLLTTCGGFSQSQRDLLWDLVEYIKTRRSEESREPNDRIVQH